MSRREKRGAVDVFSEMYGGGKEARSHTTYIVLGHARSRTPPFSNVKRIRETRDGTATPGLGKPFAGGDEVGPPMWGEGPSAGNGGGQAIVALGTTVTTGKAGDGLYNPALILPVLANATFTSIILYKLKADGKGWNPYKSRAAYSLGVAVESGAVYLVHHILAVALRMVRMWYDSPEYRFSIFVVEAFVLTTAMFPTTVLILMVRNQSITDLSLPVSPQARIDVDPEASQTDTTDHKTTHQLLRVAVVLGFSYLFTSLYPTHIVGQIDVCPSQDEEKAQSSVPGPTPPLLAFSEVYKRA
ncbi:hypothetical protein FPV67DRAFT_1784828 [Lyophyllum atratum]|nr:hypothetical protein FPV67DRAFT_1784828 [Lyophyllum atratum]